MKTATNGLISMLANNSEFFKADLLTLSPLVTTTVLRLTDWQSKLVTPDARVFLPSPPSFKRTKTGSEVGAKTTEMDLVFYANDTDVIDGTPLIQYAASGLLNGAIVQLETGIMVAPGDLSNGVIVSWVGEVAGATSIGRSSLTLKVNSMMNRLNTQNVPKHVLQPACPFQLFDSQCTLSAATFAVAVTVSSTTTANTIVCTHGKAASYFASGRLFFTTGAGKGRWFTIRDNDTTSLTMTRTLGFVPAVGDAVTLYPGCDHQMATCSGKFSNLVNFGGVPFVPAPEVGIGV